VTGNLTSQWATGSAEVNVYGMRWQPKSRLNLLSNDQRQSVPFQVTAGGQEVVDLEWPANNRLGVKDLGLRMSANAKSGGFSGRVTNRSLRATLRGVLFERDMDLGELGSAVRGVGLLSARRESPQPVLINVP
jgi:hypothetical protein